MFALSDQLNLSVVSDKIVKTSLHAGPSLCCWLHATMLELTQPYSFIFHFILILIKLVGGTCKFCNTWRS